MPNSHIASTWALPASLFVAAALLLCPMPAAAIEWGSVERKQKEPPHGPHEEEAPIPPLGPFAPGEQLGGESRKQASEDTVDDPAINRIPDPPGEPIASDAERPLPDYDGIDEGTSAGDVALWVPRVALSPLYFVSEYVVRRPLGWVVTTAEENHWPALLVDFFTFGPERSAGIIPTGLFDFGFRPSIGLFVFWNDALVDNNDMRLRVATGGVDWWTFDFIDRYEVFPQHEVSLRAEVSIRPDHIFYGIAPNVTDHEARFSKDVLEAGLGYEADLWRSSRLEIESVVRDVSYDANKGCCDDPTLAEAVANDVYPSPPGIDQGYTVLRHEGIFTADTRPERLPDDRLVGADFVAPPGTGVKLEMRGVHAAGLESLAGTSAGQTNYHHWLGYGGTVGGFVDLNERQRVVGLELIADFVDPIGDAPPVPFTELVSLGGERPLRGFRDGRLRGRSAAAARFSYTWPVWVWLDGAIHYSVGNTFGPQLEGFELDLLRSSFGLGTRLSTKRDHAFELLVAFGTESFREGGGIDNFRFVFGATSGF